MSINFKIFVFNHKSYKKVESMRLNHYLSSSGVCSRRKADEIIFDGKVSVNGKTTLLPQTQVSIEKDIITVNGKPLSGPEKKVYYILNKPKGFQCSSQRPNPRAKIIMDLFAGVQQRLFTVGRLDRLTTGLLLVTNDGEFSQKVIHPSRGLEKEYLVKTDKEITAGILKRLALGTRIENTFVKPVKVVKVRRNTVKITITEGKKHEVRLLVKSAGLQTIELKRIRLGPLTLSSNLPEGHYRSLSKGEMEQLQYQAKD
jgi:23S rRNA pseudouridine2605 synthase